MVMKILKCCRAVSKMYINNIRTVSYEIGHRHLLPKDCCRLSWHSSKANYFGCSCSRTTNKRMSLLLSFGSFFTLYGASDESAKISAKFDLEKSDPKLLTYSYLIRQAASQTVDAASNILMQATLAILDADENYRKELTRLIILLEEHHTNLSKNYDSEELWDLVVAVRSESESKKQLVGELEAYLQSVVGLLNKSAEVAYRSECDYASIAASERLQSALTMIEQSKERTKELEGDYLKLYTKVISETGKKKQEKLKRTTPPNPLSIPL